MDLAGALHLQKQGRLIEAEVAYRNYLKNYPKDAEGVHLLGMLGYQMGHFEDAINLLRKSVDMMPHRPEFYNNLAVVLGTAGRHEEALKVLKSALRLQPDLAQAHDNVGIAFEKLKQYRHAEAAFRKAVASDPGYVLGYFHLSVALRRVGKLDESAAAIKKAMELHPENAGILRQAAAVASDRCELKDLLDIYRQIIHACGANASDYSNFIFTLHYDALSTSQQLFEAALGWAAVHAEPLTVKAVRPTVDCDAGRRLRVGYVSADFREHPVGRLIEPVISGHDRTQFEVYCYSDVHPQGGDRLTHRLKESADQWRDIFMAADESVVNVIRHDRIDILVELSGHFGNNRLSLFARRPAPVQVTHFGYCGTTGMSAMDYRLTDAFSDPPGVTDRFHTERLHRLEGSCWCYRPWDAMPKLIAPPSIASGLVTFGNLNNPIKTTAAAAAAWAKIMTHIPRSRLLLLTARGAERHAIDRFRELGIDSSRIMLIPSVPRSIYADLYNQIDIILDPFPFNGDNTTCDALWMGVPVVTLAGESFHSRRGVSHLSNVGLANCIASSVDEYVRIAVTLAADSTGRSRLRHELRGRLQQSPLGDAPRFLRKLEAAYREFWTRFCERDTGQIPACEGA